LIVDDDAAFRRLCREYLRHQSEVRYEITEAATGQQAVDSFDPCAFDCILVDYRLPDTSGTGLMRRLRPEEEITTPMIMLTAVGSEDVAMDALHSGAADYIPKHKVSDQSLHRAISSAVEKARLRKSVRERTEKLKQANEQLRLKNAQIQRFYHTVSHEIKTPLSQPLSRCRAWALAFVSIEHSTRSNVHERARTKMREPRATRAKSSKISSTSHRTTCRNRSAPSTALRNCSRFATGTSSTRMPATSSTTQSRERNGSAP
jgi:DNA-binding response OmpR family regulator